VAELLRGRDHEEEREERRDDRGLCFHLGDVILYICID
jgi:hypothetical protein